jgi:hypothetical protein
MNKKKMKTKTTKKSRSQPWTWRLWPRIKEDQDHKNEDEKGIEENEDHDL